MSADNGYILRRNRQGKYVLQMYFDSNDEFPVMEHAKESEIFDTVEEALLAYSDINREMPVEYGLSVCAYPGDL